MSTGMNLAVDRMHSEMHKNDASRPRKRPRTSDRGSREKPSSRTPECGAKPGRLVVHIARDPKIQAQRSQLPVFMHEQEIVEALRHNDVVIITGATGSGKTTQVPQFLLEEGLGDPRSAGQSGMIAVTQPRRVAAVACAKRVANETGAPVGRMVGYQVRHKAAVSNATRLKFITDGVLLRETEDDLLLTRYSAVVIDEAHERTLNTDLLLALLSRTVAMRRANASSERAPLKLVIMSATLDVKGVFVGPGSLFPNAPVVEVPARQFPVTVHFARVTPTDYVEEALRKVKKIHRRLPPGGVLVFVSGRREVEELCTKIGEAFKDKKVKVEGSNVMLGVKVLPFFALLPEAQQHLVFEDFGEGMRKIVIATNVAETSVTIPGISYVVDTGKVKEQVYRGSGAGLLSSFQVQWVCKASAEQRTGRAGRTGPGHAYRLYSSAVFDQQFQEFREAEVRRVPADAIVLRLRSLGILHVDKFPFPTKPDAKALLDAQSLLERIGALQSGKRNIFALTDIEGRDIREDDDDGNAGIMLGVTRIGRELSKIPAPPRFARMIVAASNCSELLPHICRIAAMLSVGSVMDRSSREGMSKQSVFSHPQSDILTQLKAICAAEDAGWAASGNGRKRNENAVREFCKNYSLHFKTTIEILATAVQLEETLAKSQDREYEERCAGIPALSKAMETCIIRAMLCGFPDKIARRLSRDEAAAVGVPSRWCGSAFSVGGCSEPVFLQSGSSVRLNSEMQYVIFGQLVRTGHERKARGGGSKAKDINQDSKEGANHCAAFVESEDEYKEYNVDNVEATVETVDGGSEAVVGAEGMKGEGDVGRIVMENVSVISSIWVAQNAATMCEFSAHKALLKRERGAAEAMTGLCTYDPKRDAVLVTLTSSYGSQQWKMGSTRVRYRLAMRLLEVHEEERTLRAVRSAGSFAFANALLNGDVNCAAGLGATITARGKRGTASSAARQVAAALRTREVMCVRELQAHVEEVDESFLSEFVKISK